MSCEKMNRSPAVAVWAPMGLTLPQLTTAKSGGSEHNHLEALGSQPDLAGPREKVTFGRKKCQEVGFLTCYAFQPEGRTQQVLQRQLKLWIKIKISCKKHTQLQSFWPEQSEVRVQSNHSHWKVREKCWKEEVQREGPEILFISFPQISELHGEDSKQPR